MKKLICFAAALVLLLALSACARNEPLPTEAPDPTATAAPTEPETEQPTEPATTTPTEPTTEQPETVVCAVSDKRGTLFKNSSGETWLSVCVTVRNDGTGPVSLPLMELTASRDGAALKTFSGLTAYPNVIAAGESACYYDEARVDTDATGAAELAFTLAPETAEEDKLVRYTVSETQLRDSVYGGLTLTGKVKNETDEDSKGMVCVASILYDESGTVIGVLYAYLPDKLAAGKTVSFTLDSFMLPAEATAATVADIQTFAYPA